MYNDDMEIMIIAVVVIGFVVLGLYFSKRISDISSSGNSEEIMQIINMLQTGSERDRKLLIESLQRNSESLNSRLDNAAKIMGGVQKNLGEMSEIGRGMKELQSFLASPQLRGNIGEQVLKDLVTQMFPKSSFNLQYSFKSGEKVDAAIKTSAGILPIDSKFPMENFNKLAKADSKIESERVRRSFRKDIKKHINDISKKYILPEEGTMDFALMYIPSEAVYYEVVNDTSLMKHAQSSRVYPVSPTTLYAHLQTILLSFEGQKIEERAKEVFTLLRSIQKDYSKVEENLSTLQRHLNNAYNMMSNVTTGFNQLGQKITASRSLESSSKSK